MGEEKCPPPNENVGFWKRITWVGRDLWRSPGPTSMLKQCLSSRLPRIVSRQVLHICGEGDSTITLGNLFQSSVTLTVELFLISRWNGAALCLMQPRMTVVFLAKGAY